MRTLERRAARVVEARAGELAAAYGQVLPGVRVEVEGGDVVLSGRGLAGRVLDEPALRDPAGLVR
ncbi:hypothetical protein [Sphingomonas lenta]|uniref:Uncharacterized protein n=1 Tax=Sphingomonas lenta TaxID=1141887 RepID=A0A2A2SCS5_9SPHN|nr:hypothetical protein [Sphingomonas lenta]PAX07005.1 hypothetical protein CKY28_13155 [Sphingomonas lenta]